MNQVLSRIMDGSNVYGYTLLTESGEVLLVTKEQAYVLAKNKEITNVKHVNSSNYGITGINGFELRSLPSINKKIPQFDYFIKISAVLRHFEEINAMMCNEYIDNNSLPSLVKKFEVEDYYRGSININTCHIDSNCLEIVGIVYVNISTTYKKIAPLLPNIKQITLHGGYDLYEILHNNYENNAVKTSKLVGYILKNTSKKPVRTILGTLEPKEEIILNTKNAVISLSSVNINGKIKNAHLVYNAYAEDNKNSDILSKFNIDCITSKSISKYDILDDKIGMTMCNLISSEDLYILCNDYLKKILPQEQPDSKKARKGGIVTMFKR